jgi:hypothetical protein
MSVFELLSMWKEDIKKEYGEGTVTLSNGKHFFT